MKAFTPQGCQLGTSHPAKLTSVSPDSAPETHIPSQVIQRNMTDPGKIFCRRPRWISMHLLEALHPKPGAAYLDEPMLAGRFRELLALSSAELM